MMEELKQAGLSAGQAEQVERLLDSKLTVLQQQIESLSASVSALEKPRRLAELAGLLKERARRRAVHPGARTSFSIDLLCCDAPDLRAVIREDLYFDDAALDAQYARTLPRVGVIRRIEPFLYKLTFRIAARLGRRYGAQLGLSEQTIREAWFQSIMMEVWHLVSARHIARRIARSAGGELVAIPLPSLTIPYLSHGAEARSLDRFYLAAELQRCGVPVVFIVPQPDAGLPTHLKFEPYRSLWIPQPMFAEPPMPSATGEGRPVLVGAGIRGIAQIVQRHPDILRVRSNYVFDPAFGQAEEEVIDLRHLPVALTFPLTEEQVDKLPDGMTLLSTTLAQTDLGHYLFVGLGGATATTMTRARELVARHRLTEAHICDHPFFESAIVANAVKEAGGRVVLWPHSFNPAVPEFRPAGSVDAVYCVLAAGADLWRRQLPNAEVTVVPDFWLPHYQGPQAVAPEQPLTVVVICNEFGYAGVDHMDRWILEITYRKLFRRLAALAPEIEYQVRPRSQKGLNWVWRTAGMPRPFPHTASPPLLIDFPNMVFVFVGLMSSAIFEGICRGIPALYACEDPAVEEYVLSEMPDCLPMGDVAFIEGELLKCRDPAYRLTLIEQQAAWYQTEIGGEA